MTHEFDVSGYITQEESNQRAALTAAELQAARDAEKTRVISELHAKVELAKSSTASKNCVIERVHDRRLLDARPAWYLGGWTNYGGPEQYVGSETHSHFAIDDEGTLYLNPRGIGERKEFTIGRLSSTNYTAECKEYIHVEDLGDVFDIKRRIAPSFLGKLVGIPPSENPNIHLFSSILALPGWKVIEQNQPGLESS